MRVTIYKLEGGRLAVFIEPPPGKGKHPVYLEDVTSGNIAEKVLPIITEMQPPQQLPLPSGG